MRRIRFTAGRQFREMLEDDSEWFIITDRHFRILEAARGGSKRITKELIIDTYRTLANKIPPGEIIDIYNLHTHPSHYMIPYPSDADIDQFIKNKLFGKTLLEKYGINEVGYGVITDKGISLILLPENTARLEKLNETFTDRYNRKTGEYLKSKLNKRSFAAVERSLQRKPEEEQVKLMEYAQKRALRAISKEEQDVRTRTVRRTHARNAGVRR